MASTVTRPHAVSVKLLMVWYKSYPLTIQILFSALINLFPRVCCIYLDLMHHPFDAQGVKTKKEEEIVFISWDKHFMQHPLLISLFSLEEEIIIIMKIQI